MTEWEVVDGFEHRDLDPPVVRFSLLTDRMVFLRFEQDHIFTGEHNMVAQVRNGVQTIDHIAIPARDLQCNQDFYVGVLGSKYKTTRRNADGSPRQTYVLAGENIIGLHLPGVQAGSSTSSGPRIGIGRKKTYLVSFSV